MTVSWPSGSPPELGRACSALLDWSAASAGPTSCCGTPFLLPAWTPCRWARCSCWWCPRPHRCVASCWPADGGATRRPSYRSERSDPTVAPDHLDGAALRGPAAGAAGPGTADPVTRHRRGTHRRYGVRGGVRASDAPPGALGAGERADRGVRAAGCVTPDAAAIDRGRGARRRGGGDGVTRV